MSQSTGNYLKAKTFGNVLRAVILNYIKRRRNRMSEKQAKNKRRINRLIALLDGIKGKIQDMETRMLIDKEITSWRKLNPIRRKQERG